MKLVLFVIALSWCANDAVAFVSSLNQHPQGCHSVVRRSPLGAITSSPKSEELEEQKKKLFELLGTRGATITDPVLVDPITKEPIQIESPGVLLGDNGPSRMKYKITSPSNEFQGSSDTFINLLEPIKSEGQTSGSSEQSPLDGILKQALPYVPPPLRGPLASLTGSEEFIPMRDLFTSPAVSYAYERGWRQGFTQAGFPGPDLEAEMAMDYFAPVVARSSYSVVVDMSCATGKFRKIAALHKVAVGKRVTFHSIQSNFG